MTFLLENAVFLLIGLQLSRLVTDVEASDISVGRAVVVGLAVLVAVLALRPLWLFPFTWLVARLGPRATAPPLDVPERRGHLVGRDARRRHPRGGAHPAGGHRPATDPRPHRAHRHRRHARPAVHDAARRSPGRSTCAGPTRARTPCRRPPSCRRRPGPGCGPSRPRPTLDPVVAQELRTNAELRVNRIWERLGTLGPSDDETPSEARRRLRTVMLEAERRELLRIRDEDDVDHEILSSVMNQLDAEEAALSWSTAKAARIRDADLLTPDQVSARLRAPRRARPTARCPRAPRAASSACARA